jgi:membrane protease YdiL (CAAX protease family)
MSDDLDLTLALTKRRKATFITGIAIAIAALFVLSIGFRYLPLSLLERLFYSRFIFWGVAVFLFFYAVKVEKQPLLIWEKKNSDASFFIIAVFVLYLISFACGIVSAIPRLLGFHESDAVIKLVRKILTGHDGLIIFMSLTAGVTEELILRGYVMTRLALLIRNPYLAVIVSAVLFSALHYSFQSLQEFIFAFLIGAVFGLFYLKYRNIKILIVVHFLVDLISLELATHLLKK